jgi:uncharacterized C2H2 Zn-finger protein
LNECDLCERCFSKEENLSEHVVKEHSKEIPVNGNIELEELAEDCTTLTPILCAAAADNVHVDVHLDVSEHIVTIHQLKVFGCDFCTLKFSKREQLREHITEQHSNTFLNQCSDCNGSFETERDLDVHIKTDHAAAVEKTKEISSQTEFSKEDCNECIEKDNIINDLKMQLTMSKESHKTDEVKWEEKKKEILTESVSAN